MSAGRRLTVEVAYKRKGYPRGEDHPGHRLTQAQIEFILKSSVGSETLGQRFDVAGSYIRQIRRGERWRWLWELVGR